MTTIYKADDAAQNISLYYLNLYDTWRWREWTIVIPFCVATLVFIGLYQFVDIGLYVEERISGIRGGVGGFLALLVMGGDTFSSN